MKLKTLNLLRNFTPERVKWPQKKICKNNLVNRDGFLKMLKSSDVAFLGIMTQFHFYYKYTGQSLGQCKARPFNFQGVSFFLYFFISSFLYFFLPVPQPIDPNTFTGVVKTWKKEKKTTSTNLIRPWLLHWPILHAKFYIVYFTYRNLKSLFFHFVNTLYYEQFRVIKTMPKLIGRLNSSSKPDFSAVFLS